MVVCIDEKTHQLLGYTKEALPARCENTKKIVCAYVHNETCSIFSFVESLSGKHHSSVREHCTAVD